jgi:hypothetical protein
MTRSFFRLFVLLFLLTVTCSVLGKAQQAPNGSPVLTNQTSVVVNFQFRANQANPWQTLRIAPAGTILVGAGCIRFSTGQNNNVLYYPLRSLHRYALIATASGIDLIYNKEQTTTVEKDPNCHA